MQHRSSQAPKYPRMSLLNGSPRRLALLGPAASAGLHRFAHVQDDRQRYEEKLAEAQRLRGGVYLRLGAIEASQLTAGRHQAPVDNESWHLLVLDQADRICGCLRYLEHSNSTEFSQLGLAHSGLARCPQWGSHLRAAVEDELQLARRLNLPYVEVGGWALLERFHCTSEALRMALVMYALSRTLGGAIGITTANHGNCSASILKRIGGRSLERGRRLLPPYYDPQYKREIEILRFCSWTPNPRYARFIDRLETEILSLPVFTNSVPPVEEPRAFTAAAGWSGHTVSTADSRCFG